jgi:hypothetical protein
VGIGALAIGDVKYHTQHRLLVQMRETPKSVLGFAEAFAAARAFIAESATKAADHAVLALAALSARAGRGRGARRPARGGAGHLRRCRHAALAADWHEVGTPQAMRIDDDKLLAALSALAQRGARWAWIAGSGRRPPRSARTGRGAAAAAGTAPADVRRVREPQEFFRVLEAHGIGFPPLALEPPAAPAGWLGRPAAVVAGRCGVPRPTTARRRPLLAARTARRSDVGHLRRQRPRRRAARLEPADDTIGRRSAVRVRA